MVPKKKQKNDYVKAELYEILDAMVLLLLDGIIKYDKHGFNMNHAHNITDIKQTPTSFQERFLLLMDILEPAQRYARFYMRKQHADAEYLFNFFCALYNDEVQVESSFKDASKLKCDKSTSKG